MSVDVFGGTGVEPECRGGSFAAGSGWPQAVVARSLAGNARTVYEAALRALVKGAR